MFINFVLPRLAVYAPAVIIILAVVAVVFTALCLFGPSPSERRLQPLQVDRWLRERRARSPIRLWIEIIALGITLAMVAILLDRWLASPATLESVLIWGTRS